MCSGRRDEQLRPPGFPIRKSPDQSLVAGSPGLIAGSNVLLRLLVPRHPPCALSNLATTVDARVHCAVLKIRAVPAPLALRPGSSGPVEVARRGGRSLRTQQRARPWRAPGPAFHAAPPQGGSAAVLAGRASRPGRVASAPLASGHPQGRSSPAIGDRLGRGSGRTLPPRSRGQGRQVLLRKEVIQPHLPVRLPCYDFVPIASPTFDGSLPRGLGHRLRVLPTFVT